MPVAVFSKCPGTAQNAFGTIFFCGDISESGVGKEYRRRHSIESSSDNYIAGAPNLKGKKVVGLDCVSVGHLDRRMVGPQFSEDDIQSHGARALAGQLMRQPPVNMPRPIQPGPVTELSV